MSHWPSLGRRPMETSGNCAPHETLSAVTPPSFVSVSESPASFTPKPVRGCGTEALLLP